MKASVARPVPGEYAPYFDLYIGRVPDGDLLSLLAANPVESLFAAMSEEAASLPYAPGKWTHKQTLGHIIDTERIMAARALRIARADQTPLPGFDQDAFMPASEFNARTLASLLEELQAVRASTLTLFRNLPEAAWTRTGTVSDNATSVRALAYVIAGHELHHAALLTSK